jgi:hypothetical protein
MNKLLTIFVLFIPMVCPKSNTPCKRKASYTSSYNHPKSFQSFSPQLDPYYYFCIVITMTVYFIICQK